MNNVSDTYQRITDLIIEQLEAGTKPWVQPWRGNTRPTSIIPADPAAKPIAASMFSCSGLHHR